MIIMQVEECNDAMAEECNNAMDYILLITNRSSVKQMMQLDANLIHVMQNNTLSFIGIQTSNIE